MNPATTEAKYHRGQDPSIWHYGHSVVRVSQNHQPLSRDGVPKLACLKLLRPGTLNSLEGGRKSK